MIQKMFPTELGSITYWIAASKTPSKPWLVFLPGLTANHHLFKDQIEHFKGKANLFVWDPPSHGASRPFKLNWSIQQLAGWLDTILSSEGITNPVLIGQSMGGYVSQAFIKYYPEKTLAFVSIDSAPLGRSHYRSWELWSLKHTFLFYLCLPWQLLLWAGSNGCAETAEGRSSMKRMMLAYRKIEYCKLVSHGYKALSQEIEKNKTYKLSCPTLLICGKEDQAGFTARYNRQWAADENIPVCWVQGAGHNANSDKPTEVNLLIETFLEQHHLV